MKVIIADDEEKVCKLIEYLVDWQEHGMELAGFAHDGEKALKLIREVKPNIVITDIRMPEFNGLEVIREIKQEQPQIEFILISGFRQFDYAQEALKQGVSNYLLKPIDQEELNHTLEKIRQRFEEKKEQQIKNRLLTEIQQENQERIRKDNLFQWIFSKDQLPTIFEANADSYFHFKEGIFHLAVLKFDGIASTHLKNLHFYDKVEWVLKRHLNDCYDYEFLFQEGKFLICTNVANMDFLESRLKTVTEELRKNQDFFHGFSVSIGAGSPKEDLSAFQDIDMALKALSQRLVCGVNRLIFSYEVVEQEAVDLGDFAKKLFYAIEVSDMEEIAQQLEQLKDEVLKMPQKSGEMILNVVKSVFELYTVGVKKFHFNYSQLTEISNHFFSELDCIPSANEVFSHLIESIMTSFQDVVRRKEQADSTPVTIAKKYINENFSSQITLEMVSSEVGFSTSYFSTMFKKKTGESFTDYVFRKRMEEAKRQLRETNFAITEICQNVGYLDLKHFNKGFKKCS